MWRSECWSWVELSWWGGEGRPTPRMWAWSSGLEREAEGMAETVHASPPGGGAWFIQETARRVSVRREGELWWGGSAFAGRVSVSREGQHWWGGSASVGRVSVRREGQCLRGGTMGPLGEADPKDALFLSRGWGDSLQGDRRVTFHSPQTSLKAQLDPSTGVTGVARPRSLIVLMWPPRNASSPFPLGSVLSIPPQNASRSPASPASAFPGLAQG